MHLAQKDTGVNMTSRTGGRFCLPSSHSALTDFHWGSAFPGASLVAQMVMNLPAMQQTQETQVRSLGWEAPLKEGNGNPLQYSCLETSQGQRSLEGCSPWGRKESEAECLSAASSPTFTDPVVVVMGIGSTSPNPPRWELDHPRPRWITSIPWATMTGSMIFTSSKSDYQDCRLDYWEANLLLCAELDSERVRRMELLQPPCH